MKADTCYYFDKAEGLKEEGKPEDDEEVKEARQNCLRSTVPPDTRETYGACDACVRQMLAAQGGSGRK
jgi:hypothetical protein